MRNPRCAVLTVLALVPGLALAGCGVRGAAAVSGTYPAVATVAVGRADFSRDIVLTAEFIPYQEIDVMAKVSGYVKEMDVDMGDHVQRGEVLATLEIPEMQDEMEAAAAAVQAAAADVTQARDRLAHDTAAAQIAHLSFTRIAEVNTHEPGLVPQQDVDVAHAQDLEAQAELQTAQSALQAAMQREQEARDNQGRLQTMYAYTRITAPFTGVVTHRYANVGSLIQAGTSSSTQAMPLVRLAQNDLLRLILPVPVSAVPSVHIGQAVEVNAVTAGRTFPGKVVRFADEVQLSTRTMNTEVDVPNPDLSLVPGSYAEVDLHIADDKQALSLPLDAVLGMGTNSPRVFALRDGRRLRELPVQTGLQTPDLVEILGGLEAGERVAVGHLDTLNDGELVQPVTAGYETAGGPG